MLDTWEMCLLLKNPLMQTNLWSYLRDLMHTVSASNALFDFFGIFAFKPLNLHGV